MTGRQEEEARRVLDPAPPAGGDGSGGLPRKEVLPGLRPPHGPTEARPLTGRPPAPAPDAGPVLLSEWPLGDTTYFNILGHFQNITN